MNRLSYVSLCLLCGLCLSGCLGTQPPAPVVYYGQTEGEGSAGVHNVIEGDTLYSISKRYKIAMRDIVFANDLVSPFTLSVGQRLKMPAPREYTVQDGDTLYAIARIFNLSANELARTNAIYPPYIVHAGDVLTLPSANPAVEDSVQDNVKIARATNGKAVPAPSVNAQSLSPPQRQASVKSTPKPARKAKITAKTPARSSSKFLRPVNGKVISRYGPKKGGLHNDGVNISAPRGTPVAAAENGVVVYVGDEIKGSGNLVLVRHSNRWMSAYAHLDKTTVTRGQVIKRGTKLGTVGSTGSVTSPQLHFEVRRGTQALNPERYM